MRRSALCLQLTCSSSLRDVVLVSLSLVVLFAGRPSNGLATMNHHNNNHFNTKSLTSIPKHVAFICDGNSRWAESHHLPTAAGHAFGANRLVQLLQHLQTLDGVSYCTMYAFSTENWQRPSTEIDEILQVMEATASKCYSLILRDKVRVQILGDLADERLPKSLVQVLEKLQTESNYASRHEKEPFIFSLAVNYGGRQDILNASKRLATMIAQGTIDPEEVTEETFSSLLSTTTMPDPDLIIRTSGECRLSNFLLWNAAYSELYFTPKYWPDFDSHELDKALEWYAMRKRRFGSRAPGISTSPRR
jgi:undecaprenyl diphosphate synthase